MRNLIDHVIEQALGRTVGKEVGRYILTYHRLRWCRGGISVVATLCTMSFLLFAGEANSQCAARDVLRNQLMLEKAPSVSKSQIPVKSAADVPVWKTITVGTIADTYALSNALESVGCGIGGSVGEVFARPTFILSPTKTRVELFSVSAAELGFQTDTASLANIYARAQQLGFRLATAEVAPQLRLQYFDQPMGEFLIIGMEPIKTWKGELVILSVANGGAGLILIGQDGGANAEIFVSSRILFLRANEAAPADGLPKEAAALD